MSVSYKGLLARQILAESKAGSTVTDTDIAFRIRYVGPGAAADIDVDCPNSKIDFRVDGVADANVQIGAVSGSIDCGNAAADTIGKIVKYLNGLDTYECIIIDALYGDATETGAVPNLLDSTGVQSTKVKDGWAACFDTNVFLAIGKACTRLTAAYQAPHLDEEVFTSQMPAVKRFTCTSTYAAGSSALNVYVREHVVGSEKLIYSCAGAASTVAKEVDFSAGRGLKGSPGEDVVVRITNTNSCTVGNIVFSEAEVV